MAVNRVRDLRHLQTTRWFDESAAPIHLGRDLDSNICSAAIDRSACASCNGVDLLDPVHSDPVAGPFFCLSGGGSLSFLSFGRSSSSNRLGHNDNGREIRTTRIDWGGYTPYCPWIHLGPNGRKL